MNKTHIQSMLLMCFRLIFSKIRVIKTNQKTWMLFLWQPCLRFFSLLACWQTYFLYIKFSHYFVQIWRVLRSQREKTRQWTIARQVLPCFKHQRTDCYKTIQIYWQSCNRSKHPSTEKKNIKLSVTTRGQQEHP